jgi:hypothetical protein
MGVVAKEVATEEVNGWLDFMDVPKANRTKESVKEFIDIIIGAVEDGILVFNPDQTITQKLKEPMGDGNTKEIVYDFRYEIGDYQKKTKGTDAFADEVEYTTSRLSLVSKAKYPVDVFKKLKRSDYFIASKLTVFF